MADKEVSTKFNSWQILMPSLLENLRLVPHSGGKVEVYKDWMIIAQGKISYSPNDETYSCMVWLAPANWQEIWPTLNEEARKKYLISKCISIDALGEIVCGTVLNEKNNITKRNDETSNKLIIPINLSIGQNPDFLEKHLEDIPDIFENLPFHPFLRNLPCVKEVINDSNRLVTCLIPSFEIARFFFFRGNMITRSIIDGSYREKFKSAAFMNEDEETQKITALVEMDHGFTNGEKIVIGRLATLPEAEKSARYIYSNLLATQNGTERYLRTRFPFDNPCLIGATGFYLDPPNNTIYLVSQIHQSTDQLPFDLLRWIPFIDTSSIKDQDKKDKLKEKSYNNFTLRQTPDANASININNNPDSRTQREEIEINVPSLTFFNLPKVEVHKVEKTEQKNVYKGKNWIINRAGNEFTTKSYGNEINIGKIQTSISENDEENLKNYHTKFISIVANCLKKEYEVSYFHPYNIEGRRFDKIPSAIKHSNHFFIILKIKTSDNFYFYLFEKAVRSFNKDRTALFYNSNLSEIQEYTVERLLNFAKDGNKWSAYKNTALKSLVLRGFNHIESGKFIRAIDAAKNISDYIASTIKEYKNKQGKAQ